MKTRLSTDAFSGTKFILVLGCFRETGASLMAQWVKILPAV